ncbi:MULTISPECIES: hypothetical protein [Bacillaceae]|nr:MULTISPECIES: hypothetical protein [Bacillaceae]
MLKKVEAALESFQGCFLFIEVLIFKNNPFVITGKLVDLPLK